MTLLPASASPARRRLLKQDSIPHQVQVSGVDESLINDPDPLELVQQLARTKASAVAQQLNPLQWPVAGVLGCDSLLVFEGEIFGKPVDADEAITRWLRMAGHWGELHTGHALMKDPKDRAQDRCCVVTTRVAFADLNEAEIRAYVSSGEPLQCAGGFALEGRGGMHIERLDGCYSNVIGLSLPLLRRWLGGQV